MQLAALSEICFPQFGHCFIAILHLSSLSHTGLVRFPLSSNGSPTACRQEPLPLCDFFDLSCHRTILIRCHVTMSFVLCQDKNGKGDKILARIIDGAAMNLIGGQVKKYRKLRHMSQQKLSNRLELLGVYVCRGSISRIEDRTRTVTDIELCAIANVLEVSVLELLSDNPFSKDQTAAE